jgi:hypothetical protein
MNPWHVPMPSETWLSAKLEIPQSVWYESLLHWADFPGYFNDQSIWWVSRHLEEIQFAGLRQQMYVLANTLSSNMQIQITDVELSTLFGRSGGWA